MKRRVLEIIVVISLAIMAVFSLTVSQQRRTHYSFDNHKMSYDGSMKKGKFSGQGSLKLPNHDKYVGHFENGEFNGKGTFISHENWSYSGKFISGLPSGKGTLVTSNNKKYSGKFVKGEFHREN